RQKAHENDGQSGIAAGGFFGGVEEELKFRDYSIDEESQSGTMEA
ncbi:hypothetical protein HZA40_05575, partial [Candidatus Peregrinibacteria bacterium]|nr:hypothetical protein [Candidatus Peregrinibacteria bacterium]